MELLLLLPNIVFNIILRFFLRCSINKKWWKKNKSKNWLRNWFLWDFKDEIPYKIAFWIHFLTIPSCIFFFAFGIIGYFLEIDLIKNICFAILLIQACLNLDATMLVSSRVVPTKHKGAYIAEKLVDVLVIGITVFACAILIIALVCDILNLF